VKESLLKVRHHQTECSLNGSRREKKLEEGLRKNVMPDVPVTQSRTRNHWGG